MESRVNGLFSIFILIIYLIEEKIQIYFNDGKEKVNMVNIRELYHNYKDYADQEVTIGGWLRSKRDSKTFGFLVINDGTFFEQLQVVYND